MHILHYIAHRMYLRNHLNLLKVSIPDISQTALMDVSTFSDPNINAHTVNCNIKVIDKDLKQYSIDVVNKIIDCKPDAILFTCCDLTLVDLFDAIEGKIPMFYMHHGIYCRGLINQFKYYGYPKNKHLIFKIFTKSFFTNSEIHYFKNVVEINKLCQLNGYAPIDPYINIDLELAKKSTTTKLINEYNAKFNGYILIVGAKIVDEYLLILEKVLEFAEKSHFGVIAKMKPCRNVHSKTNGNPLHRHPNLTTINEFDNIYPYLLHAKLIIVQRYSTVYYECLALNLPVMLCQLRQTAIDYMAVKQYKMLPQVRHEKYIVETLEQLLLNEATKFTVYSVNPQYVYEKNKLLHDVFDTDTLKPVSNFIIQTICHST